MNKLIALSIFTLLSFNVAFAIDEDFNKKLYNEKELKEQITKIKNRRIIISNALLLTESQKKDAYNIYDQSSDKEAILFIKLKQEKNLLDNLSSDKNTNRVEKSKQKRIVSNIQKDLLTIQKDYDKNFKKILTRSQRSKYKRLNREIPLL